MKRTTYIPKRLKHLVSLGLISSAIVLSACSDNNSVVSEVRYDVTVTNLTAGQPLSPIAIIAHDEQFSVMTIGEPASDGLELLAEGGDNSLLISEANSAGAINYVSGDAPLAPAQRETLSLSLSSADLEGLYLSIASMLVNTNDAFVTVQSDLLSQLAIGETWQYTGISYDSGTEANTEASGTIPGPADGGVSFEVARDDIADQVTAHGGVVTSADGLASSVLSEVHRWDNPSIRVALTRVQ